MSFRARIALVAAAAVALAVVAASLIVYVLVRDELRSTIDNSLRANAAQLAQTPVHDFGHFVTPPSEFGGAAIYPQLVDLAGRTALPPDATVRLPVNKAVIEVARRGTGIALFDARVNRTHVRLIAAPYPIPGVALEAARSLTELDQSLSHIRLVLILIAGAGVALAAGLGLLVSRAALAPVRRLTEATETVTETRDLSERIDDHGDDELSRLASSFNAMLGALEESTRMQRQLVQDASHELRTPLTSLRTNIEVLASRRTLPPGERERLLQDVVEQLGELTTLIGELTVLARGAHQVAEQEDVRLDLVAADAIERMRRNRPDVRFEVNLEESTVRGVPASIERAVANLLDNAAKWNPPETPVEVAVQDGAVVIRDHGPGIAPEDLPHVFDRFYRARDSRGMPGSGLGLAIVKQVAEAHGGEVVAEPAEGGGTRMTMRLNGAVSQTTQHQPTR